MKKDERKAKIKKAKDAKRKTPEGEAAEGKNLEDLSNMSGAHHSVQVRQRSRRRRTVPRSSSLEAFSLSSLDWVTSERERERQERSEMEIFER
jgi:hypothetical protein